MPFTQANLPEPSQESHSGEESHTLKEMQKAILVYSRRPKEPQQCQSMDPKYRSRIHVGNVAPFDDMWIPIAKQKGVRSCTQHPITNHLTYTKLSTQYSAFTTKIESVEIERYLECST